MKLSIFPQAPSHPKTKEEKQKASLRVSSPNRPTIVQINSDEDLINAVTQNSWSPFVFSGPRHGDNFVSCDFLVYDIDHGMSIEAAEAIIQAQRLCALCLPSPNHTSSAPRFRLILPLSSTIYEKQQYIDTWEEGAKLFNMVIDESCSDVARWYGGSTDSDGFWNEGKLYSPVKKAEPEKPNFNPMADHSRLVTVSEDLAETIKSIYGEERKQIPHAVEHFVRNAHTGLPGNWICSLNSAVFSLSLSGIEDSVIIDLVEKLAPSELDKRDNDQIKRALRDGKKARENL